MAQKFETIEELMSALKALEDRGGGALLIEVTLSLAEKIEANNPVNRRFRPGNTAKIARAIVADRWDWRKSPTMKFLPNGRLIDGQHRIRAVIKTGRPIVVLACIAPDTIGTDEGDKRTLADHLELDHGLERGPYSRVAAAVVKAIAQMPAASNPELLEVFERHRAFVQESASTALSWVADQQPSVVAVFPADMLAATRARAILIHSEPNEAVDQFLHDTVNAGATAPEGSIRQQLARRFFDEMQAVYAGKARRRTPLDLLRAALKCDRLKTVKNIVTMRINRTSGLKRARRKSNQASEDNTQ